MLPIYIIAATIALAVFAKQGLDVLGILADSLLVSVVAVNEHQQMGSVYRHLRAFIVAGRCSHSTLGITIHRQSMNINHPTTLPIPKVSVSPTNLSASKPPML